MLTGYKGKRGYFMSGYITGETIKLLRERAGMTQKALADALMVTDKAVSKWETGRGLPDITLVEPLAKALRVSVAELFSGSICENKNKACNMRRGRYYVCPVCGNSFFATGEGSFCCCGLTLPPLEAEEADAEHEITIEKVENEYYVSLAHPMEKAHYISFISAVYNDRLDTVKLYPEQNAEARFFIRGACDIYAYCNKHGLFKVSVRQERRK